MSSAQQNGKLLTDRTPKVLSIPECLALTWSNCSLTASLLSTDCGHVGAINMVNASNNPPASPVVIKEDKQR